MYEAFYNFRERPFNLTPDPKYLFLSDRHREALAHLLYGIHQRCGFVLLTGEVGTGKTTLCRTLLHSLDPDTEVALIFNPNLSAVELLQTINREFGLPGKSESRKALVDELNVHLMARRSAGKNLVLLVDEAQNLPPAVLEELRLLSNLETETEKLLQIALIGQPELRELLTRPDLRQLDQRMSVRYHLEPLNQEETGDYIAHRLHVASDAPGVAFSRGAIRRLYRFSKGAPRLINVVADRALLVGFTQSRHRITSTLIRTTLREVRGSGVKPSRFTWAWAGAAAAVAVLVAGAALWPPAREVAIEAAAWPARVVQQALSTEQHVDLRGAVTPVPEVRKLRVVTPTTVSLVPETELPVTPSLEPLISKLGQVDLQDTWVSSVNAIFERWNVPMISGADVGYDVQRAAEQSGMRCTRMEVTFEEMTKINLPLLVPIGMEGIGTRYVALLGQRDGMFATNRDETQWVSEEEIASLYTGEAYVFWKEHESHESPLMEGDESPTVLWLKNALAELGYYEGPPSKSFDQDLQEAVTLLQEEHGLEADGIVGEKTKMLIYSALDAYPTPRLTTGR